MIYGTDSTQLQRHLRFEEMLLVQIPCYAGPIEGKITRIVGEEGDEYVRITGGVFSPFWAKASDLQVIAILETPQPKPPVQVPAWNPELDKAFRNMLNNQ